MDWSKILKGKLKFKEPLSKHTSFKIGGRAAIFFEPKDTADLSICLRNLKKFKMPYFLIGNGTNFLIKDSDFKGMVIRLSAPFFKNIDISSNIVTVGSGLSLQSLINYLSKTKLVGYEFLAGIPGSVAGALAMNAGATIENRRHDIEDIIYKVKVMSRDGKILNLSKKECGFSYRKSKLNRYIILEAQIKLKKGNSLTKKRIIKKILSYRRLHQDYSFPNAGCIFRNPSPSLSAGKLIERCSLKGFRYGGAMISCKHANFILNFNRATANDVIKLIDIAKKNVWNRFKISLKEEIRIVL